MMLYIEGTKIRNKTKCTPDFKMPWESCLLGPVHVQTLVASVLFPFGQDVSAWVVSARF